MTTLLWMSLEDGPLFEELRRICKRHGIAVKSLEGDVGYSPPPLDELVESADILLIPLSEKLVGEKDFERGIDLAIKRHRSGQALAMRVLIRWCDPGPENKAKLASLLAIPADERWLDDQRHASQRRLFTSEMNHVLSLWQQRLPRGGTPHITKEPAPTSTRMEEKMSYLQPHPATPSPRASTLHEGYLLGRRYRLVARLGFDTTAGVWRAVDTQDGRLVTAYVLRHDLVSSARHHVFGYMEAIGKLAHPAIVPVVEHRGIDGKHFFYVTETFEGTTLRSDALKRRYDLEEAISLVWHVGGALAAAHRAGIEHGDVRPANILSDGTSLPRLSDFKALWDARSIQPFHPGAFEAHLYAAPELRQPGAEPTLQSDIYSLCLTAIFCLRGSELPDEVSSVASDDEAGCAILRLIDGLGCGESIKAVLQKAAERSPSRRYDDVDTFRADLLRAYQETPRSTIEMIPLPAGSFPMGDDGTTRRGDKPVHTVHVSAFEIGKVEITQRRYRQVMLSNPSYMRGDELPVNRVTFLDAVAFCNGLSILEGLAPAYRVEGENVVWDRSSEGYRLPTEAEWEYAARGVSGRVYPWATDEEPGKKLCWSGPGNDIEMSGHRGPTPVGSYPDGATPEGLLDMAGNVWEWCWDWYAPYRGGEVTDPAGPPEPVVTPDRPPLRALRGAAWSTTDPTWIRASTRSKEVPNARDPDIGFRVVRSRPRTA